MRVLIAHSFYRQPGGEDRYVDQQAQLLRTRHDCEVLARHNRDLPAGAATARRMAYSSGERDKVLEVIDGFRPDVIHLHNAYPALGPAVHLAAARRKVPLVMTVHNFRLRCPNGYMFTEGAPCRRCERGAYINAVKHRCFPERPQSISYATDLWIHRFMLRLDRHVDLYLTPSRFMHDRMLEWGFRQEAVRVLRNFTDFEPAQPTAGTYGMSVGRLSDEKGLDILVRALAEAGDPPFMIVGDGPARSELEALASRLSLKRLEFLGRVQMERVLSLLREARFIAMPSVWDENAPLAALEAMALGRPLLVSDRGGLPELVQNGEGVTCRASDITGTASGIRRLMDDDELCRSCGARAGARAAREFTPGVHLEGLENAYQLALAGS
ncbi:MAG: glycosyltransferase [Actinobacteria bacterium]|nr:glycosyltransferase [Actinomycetota bacterium]